MSPDPAQAATEKHGMGRVWRERDPAEIDGCVETAAMLAGLDESSGCPVLVLWGAASDVVSAGGAQEIVDLIPRACLAVVERAGHLAAGDIRHLAVALIVDFLDEVDAAP